MKYKRSLSVALNPDKLSTQRQARAAEREAFNPNISPTKDLYFFNLADVTKCILQSDLASKMHFGLAELVDNPTQLWHTKAWAASARSTSGQFARYPPTPPPDGPTEPILPSDCVEYFCYDEPCPRCKNSPDDGKPHYGLVSEVYRDKRSDRKLGLPHDEVTGALNDIVLKVFPLWEIQDFLSWEAISSAIIRGVLRNPPFGPWKHNEHVLGLDPPIILQVG